MADAVTYVSPNPVARRQVILFMMLAALYYLTQMLVIEWTNQDIQLALEMAERCGAATDAQEIQFDKCILFHVKTALHAFVWWTLHLAIEVFILGVVSWLAMLWAYHTLRGGVFPPPGRRIPFRMARREGIIARIFGSVFALVSLWCLFQLLLFIPPIVKMVPIIWNLTIITA